MKKYYVYVIELDEKVTTHKKFRQKNPKYIRGNGCVYIGQSARKPEIRFEQHKEGYKAPNQPIFGKMDTNMMDTNKVYSSWKLSSVKLEVASSSLVSPAQRVNTIYL